MPLFCFALVFLFLINSLTSNFHSFLLPFPSLILLSFFISFFSFFALHSLCNLSSSFICSHAVIIVFFIFFHSFLLVIHYLSFFVGFISPILLYFLYLLHSLFFIFFLLSCLLSKSASLFHFFGGILPSLFLSRDRDDPQKHVCLLCKTLRIFFHC